MSKVLCTPNLCEPTSWWQGASRVVAHLMEFVRADGDVWVYRTNGGAHPMWIDLSSGNVLGEDGLLEEWPDYRPHVEVQLLGHGKWTALVEGEDFQVDYAAGEVAMIRTLRPESKVRVSFYKSDTSEHQFLVEAGSVVHSLSLNYTTGIEFRSGLVIESIRGGQVVDSKKYKSLFDVVEDGWDGFGAAFPVRAHGIGEHVVRLPIRLDASRVDEIVVRLDGDKAMEGGRASVSVRLHEGIHESP